MNPTPSPEEVARIVAGLTEAGRDALVYFGGYHDPNTIKSLRRKGLIEGSLLTEAGKAIRAALVGEG